MPKTYTCKSCKTKVTKIGITSVCRQTFHLDSDSYTDLEIGGTSHGFCIECGEKIPDKDLKKLTGLTPELEV